MEKIVLYKWNGENYISGYDYVKVDKNISMGVNSLMGFYKVNNSLESKIKDSFDVEEEAMSLGFSRRIREEYYDDLGDTIIRMRRSHYHDLLIWKKSMEEVMGTPLFDFVKYDLLCKEIERREKEDVLKNDLLDKLMVYINSLREEYDDDIVKDVINKIPEEMKRRNK